MRFSAISQIGAWSEYTVIRASLLTFKPKSLSHIEAAALPIVAMTTLQPLNKVLGKLTRKTIFLPARYKYFQL
jgi:NADPH:quinone reductase-like Zn-dependent oxidoreductase